MPPLQTTTITSVVLFVGGRRRSHDPKPRKARVNFINVFTRSFYACRSQKRKKLLELTVFFAPLGSASVKVARKMLMKLTPGDSKWAEKDEENFCGQQKL